MQMGMLEGAVLKQAAGNNTLDLALPYQKTAKGLEEIETRCYKLNPRLRGLLIMQNGTKPLGEFVLAAGDLGQDVIERFGHLLMEGFIEPAEDIEQVGGAEAEI